jgi:threonine dehydrogenase-like Zn-dependent dehydrogenase
MRQLMLTEPGRLEWLEQVRPVHLDPHAVWVRPRAVGRCDLDVQMVSAGLFPGPFTVGHQIVGEVIAAGEAVEVHRIGERVVVPFQVSCGACRACRRRHFAACEVFAGPAGAAFGFGSAGGGHGGGVSDLLEVPFADHLLLEAPATFADEALATVPDNVIQGYRAVAEGLAAEPAAEVLVIGGDAPATGLYAVAAARALGAHRVRYADRDSLRLAAAQALGAEVVEITGDWPRQFARADVVVANSTERDGLLTAIRSTAPYGRLTSVVLHMASDEITLPLSEMYQRGITLHTSRADSRRYLPEVLAMVEAGELDPAAVPTTIVDWADAAERWIEPAITLVVRRD